MSKKKQLDWPLFKRVLSLVLPYKKVFISTLVLAIILAPLNASRPYLINIMVDDYIFINDLSGLGKMAIIYMIVICFSVVLRYLFIYSTALVGQSVIKDLRVKVFQHILSLKLQYFNNTAIGTATTRTINDVERIKDVFAQGFITIIADLLAVVAVLAMMLFTSWRLTLICLLTLPLLLIATYVFKEKVKDAFQKVRNQISIMNAFLQERITGMRVVQIFNAEKYELDKFKSINRDYTQANLDAILYYAIFFPVIEIISALALSLMIWWGASAYFEGTVSFGALVAFPMYLNMLFRPVRLLADKFNTLQMGLIAADRIYFVLDNQSIIKNEGTIIKTRLKGHVVYENVRFSYNEGHDILKDINFEILPGETLAIIGNTGSGKTTIINILNRFYEIDRGRILIDGVDIKNLDLQFLRSRLSMVLQDVFLFSGSVIENITLKDSSISRNSVISASKVIGAHDFIMNMPNDYDFIVAERGANISMGQRQLISFVRALVFDPDILILDEATSSIDSETEAIIQFAIEKLIDKRSSIIIAHRLTTIRNADKILVLQDGEVKEYGSHENLININNGIYKKMYEMQFAETVQLN